MNILVCYVCWNILWFVHNNPNLALLVCFNVTSKPSAKLVDGKDGTFSNPYEIE